MAPSPAPSISEQEARVLREFERHYGLEFKRPELLKKALTHRSYLSVTGGDAYESNERLEFLGDSVLGLVTSEHLFRTRPGEHEGQLTKTKSLLVSKAILSRRALAMGLGKFVLMSHSEIESGGRQRLSILADAFESVIGAVYLDLGFEAARGFIDRWLLKDAGEIVADKRHVNYKSHLQEYVQSTFRTHPVYRIRSQMGPDHSKHFMVEVLAGRRVLGEGRGANKKEAEQAAARQALDRVSETRGRETPGREGRGRERERHEPREGAGRGTEAREREGGRREDARRGGVEGREREGAHQEDARREGDRGAGRNDEPRAGAGREAAGELRTVGAPGGGPEDDEGERRGRRRGRRGGRGRRRTDGEGRAGVAGLPAIGPAARIEPGPAAREESATPPRGEGGEGGESGERGERGARGERTPGWKGLARPFAARSAPEPRIEREARAERPREIEPLPPAAFEDELDDVGRPEGPPGERFVDPYATGAPEPARPVWHEPLAPAAGGAGPVIGGGSARETEADAEVEDVAPPDETGREPRAAGAAADAREKREERAAGAGPRDDASGYGRRRGRRNP